MVLACSRAAAVQLVESRAAAAQLVLPLAVGPVRCATRAAEQTPGGSEEAETSGAGSLAEPTRADFQ